MGANLGDRGDLLCEVFYELLVYAFSTQMYLVILAKHSISQVIFCIIYLF